jgi:hypothetical protein
VLGRASPGSASTEIGSEQTLEGRRPGRGTPLRLSLAAEQLRTAAAEWDDEHRLYPDQPR